MSFTYCGYGCLPRLYYAHLISRGRAEIVAGLGSFVESYPLFGFRPEDYDELFVEQLDLVLAIRELVEVYRFEQVHCYQALARAEYNS